MARCMLCSSDVAADAVTCPHCGGAVEAAPPAAPATVSRDQRGVGRTEDVTWVGPPADPGDPTRTGADRSAPWAAPPGPARDPSTWSPSAPAPGGPVDSPPSYGPPSYGPPSYGPPSHGPASYGPASLGGSAYGVPDGGYPAPAGGYGWVPPVGTNGLAIASLITSLVGVVLTPFCFVPVLACPVGAVLGHVALRRIASSGEQGRGMALAGIIVGWIATGLLALGIVAFVILAASG